MAENLPISKLDFDDIKAELKEYLEGQDTFKDYDFEGSGLNILLDVLAFNTHKNAYYANMVANEAFLDSSVNRASVVSHAKELGYTPRSYRAAQATVTVNFGSTQPAQTAVNFGDVFTAKIGNETYQFVAMETVQIKQDASDGNWKASNVDIKEGKLLFYTWVVDTSNDDQRFIIPSRTVDTSTLFVQVQPSRREKVPSTDYWTRNTDLNRLTNQSKVYFLQETDDEKFEIYFGDGIAGLAPSNGNLVVLRYLRTSGEDANGVSSFTYSPDTSATVTTVSNAAGGGDIESIASIKYYAPRAYQAQERAVTVDDYRVILAREYADIESVFVWGGEENDPPEYGKVFVSIKPKTGTSLTTQEKQSIARNILNEKNLVSIRPELVDPEFLYLYITTTAKYDPAKTSLNSSSMASIVRAAILNFADTELEKFDRSLRFSQFSTLIDNSNTAILQNDTEILLQKRFEPDLGTAAQYVIDFDNALFHPEDSYPSPILSSTAFTYSDTDGTNVTAYLDDDGSGKVRIFKLVNQSKVVINANIGTIDYTSGRVSLLNFTPQGIVTSGETQIRITVQPNKFDVRSRRNQILIIDTDDAASLVVSAVSESTNTDPFESSGTAFPFDAGNS